MIVSRRSTDLSPRIRRVRPHRAARPTILTRRRAPTLPQRHRGVHGSRCTHDDGHGARPRRRIVALAHPTENRHAPGPTPGRSRVRVQALVREDEPCPMHPPPRPPTSRPNARPLTAGRLERSPPARPTARPVHHRRAGGAGLPLWLPDGAVLREQLEAFIVALERAAGYQRVFSPVLGKRGLYERPACGGRRRTPVAECPRPRRPRAGGAVRGDHR